ncbi:MAG: hypothetical protein ACYTXP_01255 [Nostoc sp.]
MKISFPITYHLLFIVKTLQPQWNGTKKRYSPCPDWLRASFEYIPSLPAGNEATQAFGLYKRAITAIVIYDLGGCCGIYYFL